MTVAAMQQQILADVFGWRSKLRGSHLNLSRDLQRRIRLRKSKQRIRPTGT